MQKYDRILDGKVVAIVDDDNVLAVMLAHFCEEIFGASKAFIFTSYEAAVELLKRNGSIDLIIMDINLGGTMLVDSGICSLNSGLDLIEMLREQNRATPVLFITGYPGRYESRMGKISNCTLEYKPITVERVGRAIGHLLQ